MAKAKRSKRIKSVKRVKRSSAGKVATVRVARLSGERRFFMKGPLSAPAARQKRANRLSVAGTPRSPAVHVSPSDFVWLKRDSAVAKAPSMSRYVAAALAHCRGKLLWLADGRVRVRG